MIYDSASSNIGEVLSINSSANMFIFGDPNVRHKDWLTYSGETDRSDELSFNFSANNLTHMFNFPTQIPQNGTLAVLLFCIYLFLLMLIFVLQ